MGGAGKDFSSDKHIRPHLHGLFLCALLKAHHVEAVVYTLEGERPVTVRIMRCNAYNCRTTFGPNSFIEDGKKINTVSPPDVKDALLGITVDYLKYHLALEFRAYVLARAAQDLYENVFGHPVSDDRFGKLYANSLCIMYWLALTELYSIP